MGTTQHPRKSGATTIKRDGKIIANVGAGKNHVPTSPVAKTNRTASKTTATSANKNTIGDAHKLFTPSTYSTIHIMQEFVDDTAMADTPRRYYPPDDEGFVNESVVYTLPSGNEIKVYADDNTLVVNLRTANGIQLASSRTVHGNERATAFMAANMVTAVATIDEMNN